MRLTRLFYASLAALFMAACTSSAPVKQATAVAGYPSVPELKEIMEAMVEEFAETVWNVADPEQPPKTDEDWMHVENATIGLVETGKLIQSPNLAKDNAEWQRYSQAMIDAAQNARATVKQKNINAVFEAGNTLIETCNQCHMKYFPKAEL